MTDIYELYNSKLMTPEQLAALFESGWVVGTDAGLAQPDGILNALCARAKREAQSDIVSVAEAEVSASNAAAPGPGGLSGLRIHTMLDLYPFPYLTDPSYNGLVNGVSWFSGAYARKAVNAGYAEYIPNYYRDIPGIIRRCYHYDAFCASVSPMDSHGYFSLSATCSYSEAMLDRCDHIFLQVNKNMPRAVNNTQIHVSRVTALMEDDHALPVIPETKLSENSIIIGNLIAEQIPDGACIQLGIGAIPDATGSALRTKHDLGIHTEMFTDSMVGLIECGAVNNSRKKIHRGKTVTTFAYGSKRMYDYIDDNPDMIFLPVDHVNDPSVIALNDNMMSINAAVEVDLLGQVCAESIGTKHMSGTGGQVDFVRGATQSCGGKSFIAMEATAKNGTISKIVPTLAPGACVTTGKNDVDCVVTEYGIAELRGRSIGERAAAMINIAHPDFRDALRYEAHKRGLL